MSKFLSDLVVKDIDGDQWELAEDLVYSSDLGGIITAPKGMQTDFASIPTFATRLIHKNGLWDFGAIIHDYLYSTNAFDNRGKCDRILLEAMICKGVGVIRRQLIYRSVRLGGFVAWNAHAARIRDEKVAEFKKQIGAEIMAGTHTKNL